MEAFIDRKDRQLEVCCLVYWRCLASLLGWPACLPTCRASRHLSVGLVS